MRARGWVLGLAASSALVASLGLARADVAAPPPVAVAAPPPLAAAAAPPSAETPWFGPVYDHAVGSVVRVESASGFGAGFVFASPRHIATAFHLVAVGREVTVVFRDGRSVAAD